MIKHLLDSAASNNSQTVCAAGGEPSKLASRASPLRVTTATKQSHLHATADGARLRFCSSPICTSNHGKERHVWDTYCGTCVLRPVWVSVPLNVCRDVTVFSYCS